MAALFSWKIQGQTSADAEIATTDIEYWGDGSFRFTVNGIKYSFPGDCAEINALFKLIFTGTGGLASGRELFGVTGV